MAKDLDPAQRQKVVAAARTAASWARARRTAWLHADEAPAPVGAAVVDAPPSVPDVRPERAPAFEPPPPVPAPESAPLVDAGPSMRDRVAEWTRELGPPLLRWVPRLAIAGVAVGAAAAGGTWLWKQVSTGSLLPRPPAGATARPAAPANTGTLVVKSTPAGAQVFVDGRQRGATPLTLSNVPIGRHTVALESAEGRIERAVTIARGDTASVDEAIFDGWVVVFAPFDVAIVEGTRALRPDERNQIMLPAGPHDLRIINRTLGVDEARHVDLKPGEITRVTVAPPRSSISVTAAEAAEVWIDGTRAGDTPIDARPIDLGTHEILIKRGGTERRMTITVTAKPFLLNVDR
jgi:PEGA domain-containing protein